MMLIDNPKAQEPVKDPARLEWHEVTKVAYYYLSVNAMIRPMQVREAKRRTERKRNRSVLR